MQASEIAIIDVSTTDDGKEIYFASPLRQRGTDQFLWSKIFRIDKGGATLVAQVARLYPGLPTNAYVVDKPQVLEAVLGEEGIHLGEVDVAPEEVREEAIGMPRRVVLDAPGESLESMAKGAFDLEGRAALFDAEGPFGCAVSDSARTKVTHGTRRWLWIAVQNSIFRWSPRTWHGFRARL